MGMVTERDVITHKAYARVGLLGNPSDVYYGKTISFSLANFYATVTLRPSEELVIEPHPLHDLVHFSSLPQLVTRLNSEGYYGGVRLLMAICKVFYAYCRDNAIQLADANFTLSYDTNIPRQAGLSGSSAIVSAAFSCLLDFFRVRELVKVEIRPNLILAAEKELGIVAGLQDRVAQVYGGLVYMDFSKENMDELGHGIYIPMDLSLLPPLYLIYAENPSDSGKIYGTGLVTVCYNEKYVGDSDRKRYSKTVLLTRVHSKVRQRWLDGDEFVVSSMHGIANIAEEGKTALEEKDYSKFATLMNQNFDLRRSMFGDDALGDLNIKMVEVARKVGAASKFTGSGGAVVAFCPEGTSQVKLLEDECQKAGFVIQPIEPFPSRLNEIELKTLQIK